MAGNAISMRVSVEAAAQSRQELESLSGAARGIGPAFERGAEQASAALNRLSATNAQAERSNSALARQFSRFEATLDPAAAAARRYEQDIRKIAAAEAEGLRSAERFAELRVLAARRLQESSAATQVQLGGLSGVMDALSRSSLGFASALASPVTAIAALAAGSLAAGAQIARIGDEYTAVINRLQAATGSLASARQVYAELVNLSQRTGASITESAGAFARFSVAARDIGATNAEILTLTRTVQQAGLIAGASVQETSATVLQLGQALASGKLQGDELRSIMENMPTLAEQIARELGVSVGRLREMGSEGQLTSERVFQAILRAGERINQQFDTLTPTMGRAFGVLGQSMTAFVGQLDQALGLSQRIAQAALTAAGAVRGATAAITPNTPEQQALVNQREAAARLALLQAQLGRLTGEDGYYSQPRRGTISSTLQETAAQFTPQETRIRELREQIAANERILRDAPEQRLALARQADEAAQAEEATANARRQAAARTAATTAFNELRDKLDRERALRQEHQQRIETIDRGLLSGATDDAGAARLRAEANRELEDGLKRLRTAAQGATQDMRDLYDVLRRDSATGLLSMSASDDRAFAVIRQQTQSLRQERDRTQREAERETERQQTESQRAVERAQAQQDRFAQNWGDRIADATTQGLFDGFKGGESAAATLSRTFTNLLRQGASAVFSQVVTTPAVRYVSGLLGSGATVAGVPAAAASGSDSSMLTTGGGALSIGRNLFGGSGGGMGGYGFLTNPSAYANTGWGFADGLLNTQLLSPTAEATASALGAVDAGVGFYGPATQAQVAAAGGGGITLGGALGGAAAIGGGIYSAISGFQRGGLGGTLQGLGGVTSAVTGAAGLGAAAGLLPALGALGPVGIIGGAVLALLGGLLPGQKPSGKGQEFRLDLYSGAEERNGLTGERYSAANASQAETAARSLASLANTLGDQLGGVRLGGELAVGVTSGRSTSDPGNLYLDYSGQKAQFANNDEGAKQLAARATEMLLEGFKSVAQGDYLSILKASGNNTDTLGSNLEWYKSTYQVLNGDISGSSEFQKSLKALEDQWQTQIDKANQLSLATAKLNERRDEEISRLRQQRDLQITAFDTNLQVRSLRARGLDQQADLTAFDLAAQQEILQARASLEALGLTAEDVASRILNAERTQGEERLAIIKKYADQQAQYADQQAQAQIASAKSVLDWLNSQALGNLSSLSPAAKLAAAQGQFDTALSGNDASRITAAADALLTVSREFFGGASSTYAAREAFVRSEVADYGAYTARQSGSADLVASLQQLVQQQQQQLSALTQQIQSLASEVRISTITRNLNS